MDTIKVRRISIFIIFFFIFYNSNAASLLGGGGGNCQIDREDKISILFDSTFVKEQYDQFNNSNKICDAIYFIVDYKNMMSSYLRFYISDSLVKIICSNSKRLNTDSLTIPQTFIGKFYYNTDSFVLGHYYLLCGDNEFSNQTHFFAIKHNKQVFSLYNIFGNLENVEENQITEFEHNYFLSQFLYGILRIYNERGVLMLNK